MRVLWLSPTPALAGAALGRQAAHGGGWIGALEGALGAYGEIELAIAFPWKVPRPERLPTPTGHYYGLPRPPGGTLRRLVRDHACRLEPERLVDDLERVVELSRPDLIHVWGTEAYFGLISERPTPPVLIEIQGPATPYAEVYLDAFSRIELLAYGSLRRLVAGRSLLHRYHRYRGRAVREQRILAAARFVSGRTRWDRQVTKALAPEATYLHCDRVLRPEFWEAQWRPASRTGPLRLVSTIRGNAYKGLDVVHRAAELLSRRLPHGVEWSIVGIRPGEEVARLVERKLGGRLERRGVRLLGRQPAAEVVRRLEASDLYVHPSRIDNSPNGLAEAMLAGLPVVSTNVGGIPSLLEPEREGLLVPSGDPWALAGAIVRLAEDRALAASLGAAARERARARHDPERVARTLVDNYRRVAAFRG